MLLGGACPRGVKCLVECGEPGVSLGNGLSKPGALCGIDLAEGAFAQHFGFQACLLRLCCLELSLRQQPGDFLFIAVIDTGRSRRLVAVDKLLNSDQSFLDRSAAGGQFINCLD